MKSKFRLTIASVLVIGLGSTLLGATAPASAKPAGAKPSIAKSATSCAMPNNKYGRMFNNLPAAKYSSEATSKLASAIMAGPETNPTPEGTLDAEENTDIAAGYTYFGQFVDHDLTADDRPNDLTTPTAVTSLVNGRTPQLDLDSVYGLGPKDTPQYYAADAMHLLTGATLTGANDAGATDLPRTASGRAIIADARNDENRIVAGIHSMFIRLHNQTVDRIRIQQPTASAAQVFAMARSRVTAQYQSVIVSDFLPTIVGKNTMNDVLPTVRGKLTPQLRFYTNCAQMPVEFSVAAYRFGHSMVRGLYRLNSTTERLPVFSVDFMTPGSDLGGFSPSPSNLAIDWSLFIPMKGASTKNVQLSYKMDASIANSLSLLPLPVSSAGPADLAKRNLLRSQQLGLPSGQAVAKAMSLPVLSDAKILIGKATGDATEASPITAISSEYAGSTPLWAYILAEGTAKSFKISNGKIVGTQTARFDLGPVGGHLVAETFIGLLASDPQSILNSGSYQPLKLGRLFDNVLGH